MPELSEVELRKSALSNAVFRMWVLKTFPNMYIH